MLRRGRSAHAVNNWSRQDDVFVYVSVTCRIPAESKDVAIKAPHIMHCSVCVPVRIHIKTHTHSDDVRTVRQV